MHRTAAADGFGDLGPPTQPGIARLRAERLGATRLPAERLPATRLGAPGLPGDQRQLERLAAPPTIGGRLRLRMPVHIAAMSFALGVAMLATGIDAGGQAAVWARAQWSIAAILALAVAIHGLRGASPAEERIRRVVLAAIGVWSLGLLTWDLDLMIGWRPEPNPADLLFLATAIPGALGIVLSTRARLSRSDMRAVSLDALTVFAALTTLVAGILGSRALDHNLLEAFVLLGLPIGYFATACGGVVTALAVRARASSYIILLGAALMGLAWIASVDRAGDGTVLPRTPAAYLLSIGVVLVAVGGARWQVEPSANVLYRRVAGGLRDGLPMLAAVVAMGPLLVIHDGRVEGAVEIGAVVVVLLAVTRQSMLVVERGRLISRERSALARERRAAERERAVLERELAHQALEREISAERALVGHKLARVHGDRTLTQSGPLICREIADALGFEAVGIAVCDDGRMASLGSVGPLPAALGRDLGELEPYCAASTWSIAEAGTLGAETVLVMPIRSPEGEHVLLWASAGPAPVPAWFTDRESLWHETPVLVGAILDAGLVQRRAALTSRAEIERIVAGHRFQSVFQPVIDLETGEAVGYEALTRFDDGTRPDLRFVEAARVGLGAALESACLRSHFAAAEALDRHSWLSVNVAPDTVLAVTPLVSALEGVERDVVLEITEHSAIADYARLIERIRLLGARVRLAVDDAGSGYASLRHVLELSPDIVKLDIALVRGIDADPARQGIVAGLVHFGRQIDCTLIAEGIETEAELASLRRLGVRLGQGFLIGMPQRVDAWLPGRGLADSPRWTAQG